MMRRRMVWREVGMPNRAAKRAPPLPQVARPMACSARPRRIVIRAHGSTNVGSRSVKTLRWQAGVRQ